VVLYDAVQVLPADLAVQVCLMALEVDSSAMPVED
jgi:hypothetical protein